MPEEKEKEKKYRVRTKEGKTYIFSQWDQLTQLIEQNLIDIEGDVLAPGKQTWVPIRKVSKLAAFFGKDEAEDKGEPAGKRPLARADRRPTSLGKGRRRRSRLKLRKRDEKTAPSKKPDLKPKLQKPVSPAKAEMPPAPKPPAAQPKPKEPESKPELKPAAPAAPAKPAAPEKPKKRIPVPGEPPPKAPAPAAKPKPAGKPKTTIKRREEVADEDDLDVQPVSRREVADAERPAALKIIPPILSIMPGLGQAYNLHLKKAGFFGVLFVICAAVTAFNPGLGVPALILLSLLSMADAYGPAINRGFFGGLWFGALAGLRLYLGLVGILLWTAIVILALDAVVCWLGEGEAIGKSLDLSGQAVTSSGTVDTGTVDTGTAYSGGGVSGGWNMSNWVFAIIVLGAGLLLFFLHGFGRKLLWARNRSLHFGVPGRNMLIAGVITGVLALIAINVEEGTAKSITGHALNFPLGIMRNVLSVTETLGKALEKQWGDLVPGWYEKGCNIVIAFGHSAAGSFIAHPRFYQFVLLGSLIGFVPVLLTGMARGAKEAPPYADWLRMWLTGVRERNKTIRTEWAAFRKHRKELWEKRRDFLRAQHLQSMKTVRMTDTRLSRVEGMVDKMAEKMGIEIAPPATVQVSEELDALRDTEMPMTIGERVSLMGRWFGRFFTQTCLPKLAEGKRALGAKVAEVKKKAAERRKEKEEEGEGKKDEKKEEEKEEKKPEKKPSEEKKEEKKPGEKKGEEKDENDWKKKIDEEDEKPGLVGVVGSGLKTALIIATGVLLAIVAGIKKIVGKASAGVKDLKEKAKEKAEKRKEEKEEEAKKEKEEDKKAEEKEGKAEEKKKDEKEEKEKAKEDLKEKWAKEEVPEKAEEEPAEEIEKAPEEPEEEPAEEPGKEPEEEKEEGKAEEEPAEEIEEAPEEPEEEPAEELEEEPAEEVEEEPEELEGEDVEDLEELEEELEEIEEIEDLDEAGEEESQK